MANWGEKLRYKLPQDLSSYVELDDNHRHHEYSVDRQTVLLFIGGTTVYATLEQAARYEKARAEGKRFAVRFRFEDIVALPEAVEAAEPAFNFVVPPGETLNWTHCRAWPDGNPAAERVATP